MLALFGILVVTATVGANVFLAYAMFVRNPKSATHRLFSLLAILLTFWTIFTYLALTVERESVKLLFVRLVMFVTTPFGLIVYLLASSFPQSKIPLSKKKLFVFVGISLVVMFLSLTEHVFSSLKLLEQGFALKPSWAISIYGANLIIFLIAGFVVLYKKYKTTQGVIKQQTKLFGIGTIIAFTLITITNFLVVVVFNSISLTYFGPPFTLIMLGAIAYAIVKHKFLDIRLIVARSFAYSIALLLIGGVYAVGFWIVAINVSGQSPDIPDLILQLLFVLSFSIGFSPVKKTADRLVGKIFFKSSPDQSELISLVGKIAQKTLDISIFARDALNVLVEKFQLEKGSFVVFDSVSSEIAHKGGSLKLIMGKLFSDTKKLDQIVTKLSDVDSEEAKILVSENYSHIVLLKNKEDVLGAIVLGEKLSGETFYGEDERLLSLVTPALSVALNNTLQFARIQKFSEELKEKVDIATQRLKTVNKDLRDTDEKKNEFINMAAHELRAPLTAIKGFVSMVLSGDAGPLPEQAKSYLEDTAVSAERMIRLVNNMLNVSRIEEGRLVYMSENIRLSEIAKSAFDEFQVEAVHKSLSYDFIDNSHGNDLIFADGDKLHEVVVNFISNAIKYTESGGIKVIVSNPTNAIVRLEVEDSGMGISEEEQEKLFRKFYRVESKVGKTIGTGLGLYISKLLIEKFGGQIGVTSTAGHGSIFWFELPVATSK